MARKIHVPQVFIRQHTDKMKEQRDAVKAKFPDAKKYRDAIKPYVDILRAHQKTGIHEMAEHLVGRFRGQSKRSQGQKRMVVALIRAAAYELLYQKA